MFGLGFTSVFEQVLEGLPEADKEAIFASYIRALEEDPAQYKQVSARGRGLLCDFLDRVSVRHPLAVLAVQQVVSQPRSTFRDCKGMKQ